MKVSEVVEYLNHIDQPDLRPDFATMLQHADGVLFNIIHRPRSIDSFAEELAEDVSKIKLSIEQFENTMSALRSRLIELITELEPELYAASQRLYEDDMIHETNEYILNRRLSWPTSARENLLNRVKLFTDWRVPGMLIRPGRDEFIESLVPLDPLYIVDQDPELLQDCLRKFDITYQRRIRQYTINDRSDKPIMSQLPQSQFGLIFAANYFNYKPVSVICRYLDELYDLLRPGGRLIFTYNDCDYANAVKLAEQCLMCYTPGHKIRNHAESLGFEITYSCVDPPTSAWLELRKSGEIESMRGGQTMGKIVPK